MCTPEEPHCSTGGWYFTRWEIEHGSPSRRHGISRKQEAQLRESYCTYLEELGMKLELPQVTIACAMMLCHRFYMRQSHTKNDWKTIATVSIFLACKIQDTRRPLNSILREATDKILKLDASAACYIKPKEVFKELILAAEIVLLSTIGFDFEMHLPYMLLVEALRRLNLLPVLAERAWNYINDCLCTSLCLQYEPHYIAAGSLFLASEVQKVTLPTEDGNAWWLEFDVSPKQLNDVIPDMVRSLHKACKVQAISPKRVKANEPETFIRRPSDPSSSQSCVSSEAVVDCQFRHSTLLEEDRRLGESIMSDSQTIVEGDNCMTMKDAVSHHTCETGSPSGNVEVIDGEIEPIREELGDQNNNAIDLHQIRDKLKKWRSGGTVLEMVDASDAGSPSGNVKVGDGEIKPIREEVDDQNDNAIDIHRIRDKLKRRRSGSTVFKTVDAADAEIDPESWIESELEGGIVLEDASPNKEQRELL